MREEEDRPSGSQGLIEVLENLLAYVQMSEYDADDVLVDYVCRALAKANDQERKRNAE